MSGIDDKITFRPLNIAILTVSDSRTMADDKSGDTLVGRLNEAGHNLVDRAIVKDDVAAITAEIKEKALALGA